MKMFAVITKCDNRKMYLSFKDNIWVDYLADIQVISKFNEGINSMYVSHDA